MKRRRLAHRDEQEEADRQVHDERMETPQEEREVRPVRGATNGQLRQDGEHHHHHGREPLHTPASVAESLYGGAVKAALAVCLLLVGCGGPGLGELETSAVTVTLAGLASQPDVVAVGEPAA